MSKIQLSQEKYNEVVAELDYCINTLRHEIGSRVSEARAMGDLSENAEYHSARSEQSQNESKILDLQDIIKFAEIIQKVTSDTVVLTSLVTLEKNADVQTVYTVVSETEADISIGKLSCESPLGKLILGKRIGDTFEHATPIGINHYTVINIE